jgi:hypothetical protein
MPTSGLLKGARVYLSGPMDFVASRADERRFGWRNRVGEFLRSYGVIVFDPWEKPQVRGLHEYGREGVDTTKARNEWRFDDSDESAQKRAQIAGKFWETLHIDLRMVDTCDFVIAYCPTNIYSVGTPHEIALCRQQKKPVLLVTPKVTFSSLARLKERLKNDKESLKLVESLINDVPIKENPTGLPSLWYMPLVGGENFFDHFGFAAYKERFNWDTIPLDERDEALGSVRGLLPFLDKLDKELPKRWDNRQKTRVRNDDWLLWDFDKQDPTTSSVSDAHEQED